MSMKEFFQSKVFQGSLNPSILDVISALSSEKELMFRLSIDLKNTSYEWGKGWLNEMSNDRYQKQVSDFVEQVDFLEMLNRTEIGFKGEGWDFSDRLNGKAFIYPHPMSWNIVVPVSKIEAFMEAWCNHQNPEDIRMIRVHDIYEVIDLNDKEALEDYAKEKTREMLNRVLKSTIHNDEKFNNRKWWSYNKTSLETFWMKDVSTFDYLRRLMKKEEEQSIMKVIVEVLTPISLKVYNEEFLSMPFFETKQQDEKTIAYRMKSPSKRRAMSKANKAYAEEQGVSCK